MATPTNSGPQHAVERGNGWATAALITGLLSMALPALVLGAIGLRRSRELGGRGRLSSIIGMVAGGGWMLYSIFLFSQHPELLHQNPLSPAAPAVSAGQCFNYDATSETGFAITPCADPHDGEVVAIRVVEGNTFPGAAELADQADSVCVLEFTNYVGANLANSELNLRYFVPTDETWHSGSRTIICYAVTLDGSPLVGTVRGSGR